MILGGVLLTSEWNKERNAVDHEYYEGVEKLQEVQDAEKTKEFERLYAQLQAIDTKPTRESIQKLRELAQTLKEFSDKLFTQLDSRFFVKVDPSFTGETALFSAKSKKRVGVVHLKDGIRQGTLWCGDAKESWLMTYADGNLEGDAYHFVDNKLQTYKLYKQGRIEMCVTFEEGLVQSISVFREPSAKAFFVKGVLSRYVESKNGQWTGFDCNRKGFVVYRGGFAHKTGKDRTEEWSHSGKGQFIYGQYYVNGVWDGDAVTVDGKTYSEQKWIEERENAKQQWVENAEKGEEKAEAPWKKVSVGRTKSHHHKGKKSKNHDSWYSIEGVNGEKEKYYRRRKAGGHKFALFDYCCSEQKNKPYEMTYLNTSIALIPEAFRKEFFGLDLFKAKMTEHGVDNITPPIASLVKKAEEAEKEAMKEVESHFGVCWKGGARGGGSQSSSPWNEFVRSLLWYEGVLSVLAEQGCWRSLPLRAGGDRAVLRDVLSICGVRCCD